MSKANTNAGRVCSFPGCGQPFYAKDVCIGHYLMQRVGKPLKPLAFKRPHGKCTFPGCEHWHRAKGYCNAHYRQFTETGQAWPLGETDPSPFEVKGDVAEIFLLRRDGSLKAKAIIDAADLPLVCDRRWSCSPAGYAVAHAKDDSGKDTSLYMHKLIVKVSRGLQVDHRDGRRLNNRRSNLAPVTPAQNAENVVRPGREGLRNVYFSRNPKDSRRPWFVRVGAGKKGHYGGSFATREEAIMAARELRAKLLTHHNEARHV